MNFLFPRTITIMRPDAQIGVGAVGYGGMVTEKVVAESGAGIETEDTLGDLIQEGANIIATGVLASIQHQRGHGGGAGLPGDTPRGSTWHIFFTGLANGTVQNRDIVIDDLNKRYQIVAAYWTPLGWNCEADLLEV